MRREYKLGDVTARIALIHAVRVAIQPVEEAFARHWPEAAVAAVLACPVLMSPDSAVLWLRRAATHAL